VKPYSLALVLVIAILCVACDKGGSPGGTTGTRLTLAGNSVSRQLFERGLIPAFKEEYAKTHPGHIVDFTESYDGSGAQERAIEAGLKADIAALSLAPEIDKLADKGLAAKDWASDQNHGVPATSVVVLVVRQGNPKNVKDWNDLIRSDVEVILPNPDTSGAAKWNVAAMSAYAEEVGKTQMTTHYPSGGFTFDYLKKVRSRVAAFGKSGKEAQQIFSSGKGDVLVGWESEALDRKSAGDPIDIVYPSISMQMEPPVAVITPTGQTTNAAAQDFVKWLSTPDAQKIYAQNHYRPRDPNVAGSFPAVKNLVTIDQLGGWSEVQKKLFGSDGLWDKAAQS